MSDPILAVNQLKVEFFTEEKALTAVNQISFQLKPGEKLGIVGESGSGKSVTSLAIMGLVPPPGKITGGEIYFQNNNSSVNLLGLSEQEKQKYRGGEISMIFQEPMSSLNPVYDIGFQLTEAILLHQAVSKAEARRRAIARLQEVKLLASDKELQAQYLQEFPHNLTPQPKEIDRYVNEQKRAILKRYPHQLSGGQLQRVMIAMAIACNPKILIADEPTTALDVTVQATILELLRELCQSRGMSLIFITHDLGVIAELVDKVAVMYQGKIVEQGNIKEIFTNPQHPYTKGLLACRPTLDLNLKYLPTVGDFWAELNDTNSQPIKSAEPEIITPEAKAKRLEKLLSQPPLIKIRNLSVGFPQKGVFGRTQRYFKAVDNVSFEVYPGETLGLVGESGCGKSTLAKTILRLINPLKGEIIFRGENLAQTKISAARLRSLRREMQIVFQNPYNSLNPRMTVGKAIAEPMVIHKMGGNRKKRADRVAYLLERVGLEPAWMNRYPHEFSGGQRQRICIARALALNPQFIICDESVSALDVSVQAQVLNLLKELQTEFGLTYIFISHDLSVVKFMSDRIIVMNRGKIEEIGAAEAIYQQPQAAYTKQLIASIPTGKFT